MKVSIGGWDDEVEAELVTNFVRYSFTDELGAENTSNLNVRIEADMRLMSINKWGDATVQDEDSEFPANFVIRVNRRAMSFQSTLKVLGHEIQHCVQWNTGRWRVESRFIHSWEGVRIDTRDIQNWREPWEIEARGSEKAFLENFVARYTLYEEPWYSAEP